MHGSDQIMVREAENKPNEVGLQGHRSSNGRLNGYFTPAKVNSAPLRNVKYILKKKGNPFSPCLFLVSAVPASAAAKSCRPNRLIG